MFQSRLFLLAIVLTFILSACNLSPILSALPNTEADPEVVESQETVTVDAENSEELTEIQVAAQSPPSLAPVPTAVPANIVSQADAEELLLTNIYERVNPSVVNIVITVDDEEVNLPDNLFPAQGQGSGFVFDTDGHIITNNHVVADAEKVEVTFYDGTTVDAEVIGGPTQIAIWRSSKLMCQPRVFVR